MRSVSTRGLDDRRPSEIDEHADASFGRLDGGVRTGTPFVELPEEVSAKRRAGLPAWLAKRRPMDPKLLVVDGQATKNEIEIRLPLTIGRERGVGLIISHPLVSRKHCVISRKDDALWVKDFESANGTLINGRKITEGQLRPGDKLTVGPLTFVAVYRQNGLMSSRQLARKIADDVLNKRGGRIGTDDDDEKTPITFNGIQRLDIPSEAAHAGESSNAAAATPASSEAAEREGFHEPDLAEAGEEEEMDLFFTWAAQSAASTRRKARKAQEEEDRRRASEPGNHSSDLIESDMDAPGEDGDTAASMKTLLAGALAEAAKLAEVVSVRSDPTPVPTTAEDDDPPFSDAGTASPEEVCGSVLGWIDRIQRQIVERHREAAMMVELVNRLQQEQMELVRQQISRLYLLTGLLKNTISRQFPEMPTAPPDHLGEAAAEDAETRQEGIERMHDWLMERTQRLHDADGRAWDRIRQHLKTQGIDVPHDHD